MVACKPASQEACFRDLVDQLRKDRSRTPELLELLREEHAAYAQRGTAVVERMRGWVLAALADRQLPLAAQLVALEELDNGRSPYLVVVAARALRSASVPASFMAPFVVQSLRNMRDRDDYIDPDRPDGLGSPDEGTTAFTELNLTLRWLGAQAAGVLPQLEALCKSPDQSMSTEQRADIGHTVKLIREAGVVDAEEDCCALPDGIGAFRRWLGADHGTTAEIEFEDQDGSRIKYDAFFAGRPAIVVFFYTRCDNGQKCSLTVSKLARVQKMLAERSGAERVRTAAITYDPEFDLPFRLRGYAESRGVRMDVDNRILRAVAGTSILHQRFRLGVNFISSLVNRHRVEAFLVDAGGNVAASFERVGWDEGRIVDEALVLCAEEGKVASSTGSTGSIATTSMQSTPDVASKSRTMTPVLALALALFPKCPLCGATYLSLSAITVLPQMPGYYWMFPVLVAMLIVNLTSLGLQALALRRWLAFGLALSGSAMIVGPGVALGWEPAMLGGVLLTAAGSMVGVVSAQRAPRIGRMLLGLVKKDH